MPQRRNSRVARSASNGRGLSAQLIDNAVQMAFAVARNSKDVGVEKMQGLAEAARKFSGSMSSIPSMQEYVALTAESLDELADYVADNEFEDMIDDAAAFARRHPWAVMAMGVAAGMVAMQVVRAGTTTAPRNARRGSTTRKPATRRTQARKPAAQREPAPEQTNERPQLNG